MRKQEQPLVETVDEDGESVASVDSVFLDHEEFGDISLTATNYLELGKSHCWFIFRATGTIQDRVCGNSKVCRRQGHCNGHNTKAQAKEGIYLAMPRTRANQTSSDGLLSGLVSDQEYKVMLAVSKEENLKSAATLTTSSPHITKSYTNVAPEDGIVLNTAATPLRSNLTPGATHGATPPDLKPAPGVTHGTNPPDLKPAIYTDTQMADLETKISDKLAIKLEGQLASI
jgi:hypothetical protein